MSVRQFFKELGGKRVEGEIFSTALYSLITSIVTIAILYFAWLRHFDSFNSRVYPLLGMAIISYALILPTIRQVRYYGNQEHSNGMMIGMTVGMLAGFLAGYYVGATNGMFVGGVFGMFIGISLGVWMGNCCGVMGVLEGMMAGLMGGLMGAMTAVMTLNDNMFAMGIIVFLISAAILFCLWYMIYLGGRKDRSLVQSHFGTILLSSALTLLTVIVMVFGPRSALFVS